MKEFSCVIKDQNGMHARPAGKLATYAKQFDASIRVFLGEKEADGKRLLSLMSLGAVFGDTLRFVILGTDEDTACKELEHYCRGTLGGEREG